MHWSFQVVAWACLTVPLVMAVLVFLIPEAPGWLVRKVIQDHTQYIMTHTLSPGLVGHEGNP